MRYLLFRQGSEICCVFDPKIKDCNLNRTMHWIPWKKLKRFLHQYKNVVRFCFLFFSQKPWKKVRQYDRTMQDGRLQKKIPAKNWKKFDNSLEGCKMVDCKDFFQPKNPWKKVRQFAGRMQDGPKIYFLYEWPFAQGSCRWNKVIKKNYICE